MDSVFYFFQIIMNKLAFFTPRSNNKAIKNARPEKKNTGSFINNITGRVSNIRVSNSTYGLSDIQMKDYTFRIGNTPIEYRSKGSLNIENGDNIKVSGSLSKGLLKALAVKNLSTGVSTFCSFNLFFETLFFGVSALWLLKTNFILFPALIPAYIFGKRIIKRVLSYKRI
ncbi:MAG: hypothetical protein ACI9EK_001788 [Psychroserpens sp.]|jgi:hypothetical protein